MLSGTAKSLTLNKYKQRAFIKLLERVEFNIKDDCSMDNRPSETFKIFNR